MSESSTVVLVHGAWMDSRVWEKVVPILTAKRCDVRTVNLPGHGPDTTPPVQLTLDGYVDAVIKVIGATQDVLLVGHSLAGMVISGVAEKIPGQLERLVFLAAYLPRDGESLYQISQEDTDSLVGKYWHQDDPAHFSPAWIATEGILACFAADAPSADQNRLIETHKPEALGPMATPVKLTVERFGMVPKHYIHTIKDRAVSYKLQRAMVNRTKVTQTVQLETSHTPFFSQPERLAELIVRCLKSAAPPRP